MAFLNCARTRDNTAVLWQKSLSRYEFEITGKSIHASCSAEGGASTILELPEKCTFSAEIRFNTPDKYVLLSSLS